MTWRIYGRLPFTGRHLGWSAPLPSGRGVVLFIAILYAMFCPGHVKPAHGQTPNTLIAVTLLGVGTVTVEAVLTPDSVLLLPAADVAQLLGLETPPSPWTTVAELQHRFPPIQVFWSPRELRVVIHDDLAVLPATRRLTEQQRRLAEEAARPQHRRQYVTGCW